LLGFPNEEKYVATFLAVADCAAPDNAQALSRVPLRIQLGIKQRRANYNMVVERPTVPELAHVGIRAREGIRVYKFV
jgi:hypothetical protein